MKTLGRRSVLLIAAIVVALVGTFLVYMYANEARTAGLTSAEPVQVLVATSSIPAGTSGASLVEAGAVELQTLPRAAVPDSALSDLQPVSSLFTASAIYPGQALLAPMFVSPESVSSLSLPEGTVAMSVSLEDPQRVAGFVSPGAEVAVFATIDGEKGSLTSTLLSQVKVVGVGQSTVATRTETSASGATNTEQIPTAILTLAVTDEQAKKLAFATNQGELHFALRSPDSEVEQGGPAVTTGNLFR